MVNITRVFIKYITSRVEYFFFQREFIVLSIVNIVLAGLFCVGKIIVTEELLEYRTQKELDIYIIYQ